MRFLYLTFTILIFNIQLVYGRGKCTGSEYCTACKTCNYCKHCAGNGGSCGVCGSGDQKDHQPEINVSEKRSLYNNPQNSENEKSGESNIVIYLLLVIIGLLVLKIVQQKIPRK